MGFFEDARVKKSRRKKDEKIALVQQLIDDSDFDSAGSILHDIIMNSKDIDPAYRAQEIDELLEICKGLRKPQKTLTQEEKTATEDRTNQDNTSLEFYVPQRTDIEETAVVADKAGKADESIKSAQKEEAFGRLKSLVEKVGLDDSVLDCWKDGNFQLTYCDLDENYVGKAADMDIAYREADGNYIYKPGDVDWMYEVKEFEENDNAMVYHVIQQQEGLYLLYVGIDRIFWGEERLTENNGSIFTNVTSGGYNISAYFCSPYDYVENTFVDIELFCTNGILSAKLALEEVEEEETEECEETEVETDIEEDSEEETEEYGETVEEPVEYTEEATEDIDEKVEEFVEEAAEQPIEEILTEIDGKDGQQWYIEANELYQHKRYTAALNCMENAAKLGVIVAMHNTAAMYSMGMGTQTDAAKAFSWYEKAALAGAAQDMLVLSELYHNGEGVEKDDSKSFYWCKKAAEEGDDPAYWFTLARAYDNGIGTEKDAEKAFYWLEKAAQGGLKEAFIYYAYRYDDGEGVTEDKAKALYWYEKAAETGNTSAMVVCYRRYMDGVGTSADYDKATHWLTEACKKGNAEALYELGIMHIELGKTDNDLQYGYELLEESAGKDFVDAMMRLADDYSKKNKDSKVEQDLEKAFYWYEKAANAGNSRAMVVTFFCYYNGAGTEQDIDKASKWLWASIDAGETDGAVYMSSRAYKTAENGEPELYEEALNWAEIAVDGGHEMSIKILPDLCLRCLAYETEKEQHDPAKIVKYFEKYIVTEVYENLENKRKADMLMSVAASLMKITEQYERSDAAEYGEYIIRYFETAAEYGETVAMTALAGIYGRDFLTDIDEELSFYWRKRAYDNGDAESAFILANMYYEGFGCQQNYEKAFELFTACAEEGNTKAKIKLLGMYTDSEGCKPNRDKIFQLSQEIADAGYAIGYVYLGISYANGVGCQQDDEKAFECFQKAAAQGFHHAYYYLGESYENGYGCELDWDKAFEMYKIAADGGNKDALEKVALFIRMKDVVDQQVEKTKEIAKKYINSSDPEMRKLAREALGME